MPMSFRRRLKLWWGGILILCAGVSCSAGAGPTAPDPCTLVTVSELEEIVGKIKEGPKSGDQKSGDLSCLYVTANHSAWIEIRLHEGDFELMKKSFGGKAPAAVPDLGKDSFLNENYQEFSAELFTKKGTLALRVSMAKGPAAREKLTAIAKKALLRL
jgi:hypothetical protein